MKQNDTNVLLLDNTQYAVHTLIAYKIQPTTVKYTCKEF